MYKGGFKSKSRVSTRDLLSVSTLDCADPTTVADFHSLIDLLQRASQAATPTPFHHVMRTLAKEGRLRRLYTQNVDALELRFPELTTTIPLRKLHSGDWPKTIQLHGNIMKAQCRRCWTIYDSPTQGRVGDSCSDCAALVAERLTTKTKRTFKVPGLRPRITLYGEEANDDTAIDEVMADDLNSGEIDGLVVVGTQLRIKAMQRFVKAAYTCMKESTRGVAVWINTADPPPKMGEIKWDLVVRGEADDIAARSGMSL